MGSREEVPPQDMSQDPAEPGSAGSEDWDGGPLKSWRRPSSTVRAAAPLVSSGVPLNVVFHFVPEVLLVPQVMLCSLDIQWVIEVQKISKQRV